ncbi:MAG: ATP-binding protein [Chitinivibrionales bacterium]
MYTRSIKKFSESSFLFGPRGTGKSTWLMSNYPEAVYVDLLDSQTYRYFSARPERILALSKEYSQKKCFIIDEVQRIPELLSNIHLLMETENGLQFILTGSSSRKLKQKGVDLLAGRAVVKHFHPLLACEMQNDFDLQQALINGMVPLIVSAQNRDQTRNSYIDLYVNEEVKEEGLTRNIGNFSRFLEVISFSQGSVINLSEISRDSEVKRNTVDSYVSILEDLLIAVRIPVFTKRAKRALISNRKFYFFDCGVYRGLRPSGPLDDVSSLQGISLETLVLQHLRAWIDYAGKRIKLYFWRTRGGSEVDFILYGENTFVAIEVKNTMQPRAKDLSGLKAFMTDYPEVTPILLYRGHDRLRRDGVFWIPVEKFLIDVTPGVKISDLVG